MDSENLNKDLVSDTRNWRLSIEISEKTLEVVTYSLSDRDTLIYHTIPLGTTSSSTIAALGDAVYDNTLLLSDFACIDVLIDTPRFIITPSEFSSGRMDSAIISALWPGEDLTVISHPVVGTTDILLAGMESKLQSFVRRTFPGSDIKHRLTPLLSYLIANDHEVGVPTMYVIIRDGRIDVVCFSERGLEAVNTYITPTQEDALYYILAVAKGSNLNINKDEIVICGDAEEASSLQSFIRKYSRNVLTMDAPYEVAALGSEALKAPLELTLIPLCV